MLKFYNQTELELWVTKLYTNLNFRYPSDLNEEIISDSIGIELFFKPKPSMRYDSGDYKSITIDSRQPRRQQRVLFYHELGHILRGHTGKQHMMEKAFRELQEAQASHFIMYAAIPFYMVVQMDLPHCDRDIISLFVQEFGVSDKVARDRVDQINRRIFQGQVDENLKQKAQQEYTKAVPQPYSSQTVRLLEQLKKQTGKDVLRYV